MSLPTETEGEITFIYLLPISAEPASSSIHILIVPGGWYRIPPSVQVLYLLSRLEGFFVCFVLFQGFLIIEKSGKVLQLCRYLHCMHLTLTLKYI